MICFFWKTGKKEGGRGTLFIGVISQGAAFFAEQIVPGFKRRKGIAKFLRADIGPAHGKADMQKRPVGGKARRVKDHAAFLENLFKAFKLRQSVLGVIQPQQRVPYAARIGSGRRWRYLDRQESARCALRP